MPIAQLKPFIPSGADFETSKKFFTDLDIAVNWESEGLAELMLGNLLVDLLGTNASSTPYRRTSPRDLPACAGEPGAGGAGRDPHYETGSGPVEDPPRPASRRHRH